MILEQREAFVVVAVCSEHCVLILFKNHKSQSTFSGIEFLRLLVLVSESMGSRRGHVLAGPAHLDPVAAGMHGWRTAPTGSHVGNQHGNPILTDNIFVPSSISKWYFSTCLDDCGKNKYHVCLYSTVLCVTWIFSCELFELNGK